MTKSTKKKKIENRRFFHIANRFQGKILALMFLSTIVPTIIVTIGIFYLIFHVVANEIILPEAIGCVLIPAAKKAGLLVIFGFLISAFFIWLWALRVSHRLAGPLERLCEDLDARVSGITKGYIYFRKGDYLSILAGRINSLLDKTK